MQLARGLTLDQGDPDPDPAGIEALACSASTLTGCPRIPAPIGPKALACSASTLTG